MQSLVRIWTGVLYIIYHFYNLHLICVYSSIGATDMTVFFLIVK